MLYTDTYKLECNKHANKQVNTWHDDTWKLTTTKYISVITAKKKKLPELAKGNLYSSTANTHQRDTYGKLKDWNEHVNFWYQRKGIQ